MTVTLIRIVLTPTDYDASIERLRAALREPQRKKENYLKLELFDAAEQTAVLATLLMHSVSMYIVAFVGAAGQWYYFKDVGRPDATHACIAPGDLTEFVLESNHNALGTDAVNAKHEPTMKYQAGAVAKQLQKLAQYAGGKHYDDIKAPLSFAVVACAEAARFARGQQQIRKMLGSQAAYFPYDDWGKYYSKWQALSTRPGATPGAAEGQVVVRYMALDGAAGSVAKPKGWQQARKNR